MYDIEIITPPAVEPVTLEEAKQHCFVDFNLDDAMIEKRLIQAARQACEQLTARNFITTTLKLTLDDFPRGDVFLPRGEFQSLNKVTYWEDSTPQPIPVQDIQQWGSKSYPRLEYVWPKAKKVEIEWTCGYGDTADEIPEGIKQCILIFVEHYYDPAREMVSIGLMVSKIPESARDLLKRFYLGDEFMTYDPNAVLYVNNYAS